MSEPGSWRLRTEHVTTFAYDDAAFRSYNEVRQVPQTNYHQTRLEAKLATSPAAPQYTYWDYWGTQVVAFNIDQGHKELVITSSSLVETQSMLNRPELDWSAIDAVQERYSEYLARTVRTAPDEELVEIASGLRAGAPAPTVEAVTGWVHDALEYVPGVTGVQTSAVEAAHAGRGVCQDFAHLSLALLRAAGVPARYVSGYLHPDPEAPLDEAVLGESHAWIEAWVGEWWPLDPTNATPVGARHIVVARGRDYADVPPVKGVYAGNADHQMSTQVRLTRVA